MRQARSIWVAAALLTFSVDSSRAAGDQTWIIQWNLAFEKLMSALSVATAQVDARANQVSTAMGKAKEASASSIAEQQVSLAVAQTKERYGMTTGQGFRMCQVAPGVATINTAKASRDSLMQTVSASDASWMREGGDRTDVFSSLMELRRELYCSAEEQARLDGWCSASLGGSSGGGYQAGNTDASVWMLNRGYGGEEAMTGMDYVDTVAPLPTIPAASEAAQSAEIALARASGLRSAALLSAARTGMQNLILDGMQSTEDQ